MKTYVNRGVGYCHQAHTQAKEPDPEIGGKWTASGGREMEEINWLVMGYSSTCYLPLPAALTSTVQPHGCLGVCSMRA